MDSILVTGSNRGLGLEWVRQYADKGWRVFATCRYPDQAEDLHLLTRHHDNVSVHRLDVTVPEDITVLSRELEHSGIDILVNNAGVYHEQWGKDPLGQINYSDWQHTFEVNTLGPMRVSEALVEHVAKSNKRLIVAITSHMGSIADITSANDYAYRSSKAALNAAMKGLSIEVVDRNIGVLLLHPGWVRTRMGGESAPISVQESVRGMSGLLDRFTIGKTGCFLRYDGTGIPW